MRVWLSLLVLCLLWPSPVSAQAPATPASKYVLDQPAQDLATAQSYTYRAYADGAPAGVVVPMTCAGAASPFTCTGQIGAFTQGSHSVTFTAANAAGESSQSAPVLFIMAIVPAVPLNPRIQ